MRHRERGSALLVTIIIIAAALAGAAVLTAMQASSQHGAALARDGHAGLYCAEAGLTEARATIVANAGAWSSSFGATEPAWLAGIDHDLDGNGAADFEITLRDNDDETPNDPSVDVDQTIFVMSTCIAHPERRTQVTELLRQTGERKLWLRTE